MITVITLDFYKKNWKTISLKYGLATSLKTQKNLQNIYI